MKNTDFIKLQVLRKFIENSSSACYQAASAVNGKLKQLQTILENTKLERDLIKAHFKTVLAQNPFSNKHSVLVIDQHSNLL